ncbi:MAG: ATP-binding protein, partial [Bacteroidota bacterium]
SNNARHMYYLIEDILQYSLLENQPEVFAIDLNLIVRRVQGQLSTFIREKGAIVQSEDLPIVIGHESQLELLFQNLIENGIKYNESARPEIVISTKVEADRNLIFITDNGIGIDETYQAKIFDMFYRLHTQDSYSGTGIGLAICQKIIQKHQGDISLESQPGEGSVFQLSFPKVWNSVALEPA